MLHVVVGTESGKLLAGHDKKMTAEQAQARAKEANARAEDLGITTRYKAAEVASL